MSLIYGFLLVSGTRIEVLGYTKQNVFQIQSAWPSYAPSTLWQRTSRFYQDHRPFSDGSYLPSSRLPINRVPAQLSYRVIALWNLFLPDTGSFFVYKFLLTSVSMQRHLSADVSRAFFLLSSLIRD